MVVLFIELLNFVAVLKRELPTTTLTYRLSCWAYKNNPLSSPKQKSLGATTQAYLLDFENPCLLIQYSSPAATDVNYTFHYGCYSQVPFYLTLKNILAIAVVTLWTSH